MYNGVAVLILVAAVFGSGLGHACERVAIPPSTPTSWIVAFEGLVTEYVTDEVPIDAPFTAPGLLVTVVDPIALSEREAEFRVVPLGTGIGCEPVPRDDSDLRRQYPLGARVTVVGRAPEGCPRLVLTGADDFGHVARVPRDVPLTRSGLVDFRALRVLEKTHSATEFSFDVAWRNAHLRWFSDFAFFQCLIALDSDLSSTDRLALLENMAYYPGYHAFNEEFGAGLFRELLKRHSISRRDRRRLRKVFRDANQAG